ncbi:MAG: tRNA (adenosine(37)-N6)-dimethylallyltransferase MiaA [Clostridia bacterium]|nr:tRNA (adenosine(37)-N6)-dimethylallyltransferase MiaA [Clostridia bacterium]
MSKNKPVIYIVGPTASGKTSFSIELAKSFNGEIVSSDSMQIYKGMHIASAAPDESEKQEIEHHLFEFLNPTESFSVGEYVKCAKTVIDEIHSKGKIPIVVGGTGLYISALAENLDFGCGSADYQLRDELEQFVSENGLLKLYEYLKSIDPKAAKKISENDKKRIIRAVEIYKTCGKTKTEMDEESKNSGLIYDNLFIGLNYANRETLYSRINQRVDIMLENGLIKEAENAYKNVSGTAAQAIGHKEFFEYFDGNMKFEDAVEHLKMQTRRYAKRQLTWFRKNDLINWIIMDEDENPLEKAKNIVKEFLA